MVIGHLKKIKYLSLCLYTYHSQDPILTLNCHPHGFGDVVAGHHGNSNSKVDWMFRLKDSHSITLHVHVSHTATG